MLGIRLAPVHIRSFLCFCLDFCFDPLAYFPLGPEWFSEALSQGWSSPCQATWGRSSQANTNVQRLTAPTGKKKTQNKHTKKHFLLEINVGFVMKCLPLSPFRLVSQGRARKEALAPSPKPKHFLCCAAK